MIAQDPHHDIQNIGPMLHHHNLLDARRLSDMQTAPPYHPHEIDHRPTLLAHSLDLATDLHFDMHTLLPDRPMKRPSVNPNTVARPLVVVFLLLHTNMKSHEVQLPQLVLGMATTVTLPQGPAGTATATATATTLNPHSPHNHHRAPSPCLPITALQAQLQPRSPRVPEPPLQLMTSYHPQEEVAADPLLRRTMALHRHVVRLTIWVPAVVRVRSRHLGAIPSHPAPQTTVRIIPRR